MKQIGGESSMTHCHRKAYQIELPFCKQKNKKVIVDFEGWRITSDAGAIFLSAINKKYSLTKRITKCLVDRRDERYTKHSIRTLLKKH